MREAGSGEELVERGRATWPEVELDAERFSAYVAERADDAAADLCVEDLYLACACAAGDQRAIRVFFRELVPQIDAAALGAGARASDLEEVKGRVLHALFVAEEGRACGIAGYAGRGRLRSWVRSVAIRTAMRYLGNERRAAGDPDEILDAIGAAGSDPELEHLRGRFGAAFRDAFRAALGGLSPRERNLLRQHYIDGLTVDQLGALHRVHRATAARWVASARESVFDTTRARLIAELGLAGSELDSIMRLLRSELDISIARWLAV